MLVDNPLESDEAWIARVLPKIRSRFVRKIHRLEIHKKLLRIREDELNKHMLAALPYVQRFNELIKRGELIFGSAANLFLQYQKEPYLAKKTNRGPQRWHLA